MYQPATTFSCCIIGNGKLTLECAKLLLVAGHQINAIVTTNEELRRWAVAKQIPCLDPSEHQEQLLSRSEFDYLFSIINPCKVPDEILRLPKKMAINFHDAPLPRYAGLHVTAWAILNQESSFGVTWHQMSSEFDAGQILKQIHFPIDLEETAFSLSVKCFQKGVEAFLTLIDALVHDEVKFTPQDLAQRSVFLKTKRPEASAIIDWQCRAVETFALIRGLSFAPDANPLALPKVLIAGQLFLVNEAALYNQVQAEAPGTVLRVAQDGLTVAASEGAITLKTFSAINGQALTAMNVAEQLGLKCGDLLVGLSGEERNAITSFDESVAAHESYWLARLLSVQPYHFPDQLNGSASSFLRRESLETLPDNIVDGIKKQFPGVDFCDVIIALYYCFLDRMGADTQFAIGLTYPRHSLGVSCFADLYCSRLPFSTEIDSAKSLKCLVQENLLALGKFRAKGGYARDLVHRNPTLLGFSLPVGIEVFEGEMTEGHFGADVLTLSLQRNGPCIRWQSNGALLADDVVARMKSNFTTFLSNAVSDFECALGAVALINAEEQVKILQQWNNTLRDVDKTSCVHDLFTAQAEQRPDAIALVFRDESITYSHLNARANHLALRLQKLGTGADTLVGIFMDRSIDMVVGLLGVLKAGGAYVPLDPGYPRDRIALMAEDADLSIILTQSRLRNEVPGKASTIIVVDEPAAKAYDDSGAGLASDAKSDAPRSLAKPGNLAYVIYTSGSTGTPKGVMIEHRNVVNFFAGMDEVLAFDGEPGVWLAVTSISFDISVLELFWTLCRGFKVILQEEDARTGAALNRSTVAQHMDVGLFYFSSDAGPAKHTNANPNRYKLLLEGAKFADQHGFSSVWTPERHFHLFGGLYPNPSVTSAAIAAITSNISIRAGSVVLPLHNPVRVVEEWSVVDNISGGRVGFAFASGWHANDFSLMPENYENRKQVMFDGIETVRELWSGKTVTMNAGDGKAFTARVYPEPIQKSPPIWITTAGNVETFRQAGEGGFNVLTNLLGQSIDDITAKITAYREGRNAAGHLGDGSVAVMVHTFLGDSVEQVREIVKAPFCQYLKTSFDLVKMAPWAFPAFRQPSKSAASDPSFDAATLTDEDLDALLEHAFDRYFETAGVFGTPSSCLPLIDQLKRAGVNEIACLIDFGVDDDLVLNSLEYLDKLRELSQYSADLQTELSAQDFSIAAQIQKHQVTHFQCTPSMARILATNPETLLALKGLDKLLLGGEALPTDLAQLLKDTVAGDFYNVYGPTETCIWSTAGLVPSDARMLSIGRPIANTYIYILNEAFQPVPIGVPGELFIGGQGVVRGYLGRQDLTRDRFLSNPFDRSKTSRMYRTGDLVRYRQNAEIEYLGRLDQQVKLRGYRIELGEIESVICEDAQVKESVVVVQELSQDTQSLVAYVVPELVAPKPSEDASQPWQTIWNETYKMGGHSRDGERAPALEEPTLNTAGWLNSYTGAPHSRAHMLDWANATANRILSLKPKRVLEIGCGTGMILYRVAPHCERYVGVDFSSAALALIERQLGILKLDNVALVQGAADRLTLPDAEDFDLIIINSVAQYFPTANYLIAVIEKAISLLSKNGQIFMGDVRSVAHMDVFHQSLMLERTPPELTLLELQKLLNARKKEESELLIDPNFFAALQKKLPQITAIDIQMKRGQYCNEMSAYRYDAVLSKGSNLYTLTDNAFVAAPCPTSLPGIKDLIAQNRSPFVIRDLGNARIAKDVHARDLVKRLPGSLTVAELRSQISQYSETGFDPEQIYNLETEWGAQLTWAKSGKLGCFDAYFIPPSDTRRLRYTLASQLERPAHYCHEPMVQGLDHNLVDRLKVHLAERLPEFMVPTDWVVLPALPLTPNGKIDRKALPKPEKRQRALEQRFVAPESDIEQKIAKVLQDMLNLEKIGTHDNFMDLGANSLLIVQANSRLNQLLSVKVSLVSMYRFPTIASLAEFLQGSADESQGLNRGQQRGEKRRAAQAGRRQRLSGSKEIE